MANVLRQRVPGKWYSNKKICEEKLLVMPYALICVRRTEGPGWKVVISSDR